MKLCRHVPVLALVLVVAVATALGGLLTMARHADALANNADLFPSEAAIQFRHARHVAEGETIPRVDQRLQWPEGVDTRRDMTPGIEYVTGWSHRLVGALGWRPPLLPWAAWVVALLSALTAVPIFLLGRELAGRHGAVAGLAAAALWMVHPFATLRVIGNFGRENLALPFLFLGFWGMVGVLRLATQADNRQQAWRWGAAVVGFAGALAFWHLSRTVVLIEFGLLWLACMACRLPRRTWLLVGGVAAALGVFSLLHPVLRSRGFAFSPGLVLGYGLLAGGMMEAQARRLAAGGAGAAVALVALLVGPADDSHVAAVAVAKVRHFLRPPSDPTLLPFEARALWLEAFNSPGAAAWIYYVGVVALVIVAVLAFVGTRRLRAALAMQPHRVHGVAQLVVYGLAFTFFFRLHSIWIGWLAVAMGSGLVAIATTRTRGVVAATMGTLAGAVFLAQTVAGPGGGLYRQLRAAFGEQPVVYATHRQSRVDLIDWVRNHTEPGAVFAGHIGTMAILYTETDSAVVLQPKWENSAIRPKVEAWTTALYGSESELAAFCRAYEVEYLVLEPRFVLEEGPGSLAYQAGQVSAQPDDPVVVMQFQPLEFLDFELVYRNPHFQIYRFLPTTETPLRNLAIDEEPIYDGRLFARAWDEGRRWNAGEARATARQIEGWYAALGEALALRRAGQREQARALLEEIVRQYPAFHRAWAVLGVMALEANDAASARVAFERALVYAPNSKAAREGLEHLGLSRP